MTIGVYEDAPAEERVFLEIGKTIVMIPASSFTGTDTDDKMIPFLATGVSEQNGGQIVHLTEAPETTLSGPQLTKLRTLDLPMSEVMDLLEKK